MVAASAIQWDASLRIHSRIAVTAVVLRSRCFTVHSGGLPPERETIRWPCCVLLPEPVPDTVPVGIEIW